MLPFKIDYSMLVLRGEDCGMMLLEIGNTDDTMRLWAMTWYE